MCVSCTHLCVCVCVCVQNLSASEIIIFGYLSHVMRRRTPQSHIVNWKQLEGSLAWQGQCKICIPRVAPFCVEGEMQNSKPVPAAQIIPFISAHKNVIQLSDVDSSVYHPSVTCSKVKLIEPIIKCCNNYTISWQIQNWRRISWLNLQLGVVAIFVFACG